MFLGQFKDYLAYSIHEHLNKEQKNSELCKSVTMMNNLSKICELLNVQLTEIPYIAMI